MRLHGWVDQPEFYAVNDENGVTIIGHRRMAVAKELGIEPRIRVMDFSQFGSGDAADIERMKLAVLSNIGGLVMSKKDRLPVVQRLAPDWTQASIAEALGVSREAIKKDIAELRQRGDLAPSTKSRQGGPGRSRAKHKPEPDTDATDTNLDQDRDDDDAGATVINLPDRRKGRANSKEQITAAEGMKNMDGALSLLESKFDGRYEATFTPAIAAGYATEFNRLGRRLIKLGKGLNDYAKSAPTSKKKEATTHDCTTLTAPR